ncbi:hypothetical protein [Shewanella sp. UCD-KL21]|uniref:hypothetical protein n=1 Tax=Shewanella sp. UCD-KL21 TaxID=1917164 RepID=UPI0009703967|nr:hypothetical protein [Shewanella sp. UCD-KL21]
MLSLLRHRLTFAFTLLTLLSQLVFANGELMVPKAHADIKPLQHTHTANTQAHTTSPQSHTASTQAKMPETQADTRPEPQQKTQAKHTVTDSGINTNSSSNSSPADHCDTKHDCQSDCDNCLFITLTGTLQLFAPWAVNSPSDQAIATPMPYFHSIYTQQNLRPPIG